MYIVEAKIEDIRKIDSRLKGFSNELEKLINKFIRSPFNVVEVKDYRYKTAFSFQNAATKYIKKMNIKNIKIITSGGKVFILKLKEESTNPKKNITTIFYK